MFFFLAYFTLYNRLQFNFFYTPVNTQFRSWLTPVLVLSCSVMSDSCDPMDYRPCRHLCPWTFSRQEYWSGLPSPPSGDLPNPGTELMSPTLQADSLPSELPGKPKNTGVGSLTLLQGIFLTQELNRGLLHCRWIFYQLSYQGSPTLRKAFLPRTLCSLLLLPSSSLQNNDL